MGFVAAKYPSSPPRQDTTTPLHNLCLVTSPAVQGIAMQGSALGWAAHSATSTCL